MHIQYMHMHAYEVHVQVPAVVLVCRNSTDTAYFQRLRPYPRIMLRRHKCLFKDYDKTPIGFGVVVFCIAKSDCRSDDPLTNRNSCHQHPVSCARRGVKCNSSMLW